MKFEPTPLAGAFVIDVEPVSDERGFFARVIDHNEFAAHGLCATFRQCCVSYNARAGTLRGMHYQAEPWAEAKLVACTRGAIHDVVLDLRPGSPTFCRWHAVALTASNRRMLYIPEGCAHGFQTLCDDSEVLYHISVDYVPDLARGVRWNDPAFAIDWPATARRILSPRDATCPDFAPPLRPRAEEDR